MVLKLFRRAIESAPPAAQVPAGTRLYAIGDIHGRLDLLDQLLFRIEADNRTRGDGSTQLIFLGDLVDRGPNSAGVVQRALEIRQSGRPARFLMGNHEEVFLKALNGSLEALRFFVKIGGRATILSYGFDEAEYDRLDYAELLPELVRRVPAEHVAFLRAFEDRIAIGDYLFVHAGVRPRVPLDEQSGGDLRWIRSEFLDFRGDHGAVVVHGHTITDQVEERPNRIGIDTGAFASGRLTALGLEGSDRWYLST
ncbi:serine/threonine protein phosphatase [Sphingomonas sp. MAH-20]|uniref:Serine/threonine protein phosphatase n=1 Tax=Sphingomonas horti TaxID=2682842 RepID=A0A6I4J116_9SPHN|nr:MULTISPECIES: metallophosphoesterase family protein [Sphingomonas]MBA2919743.1 serine/threonine protein phosphatase [Sphingomonas sp. CGMCC 1.13658]MVO77984.1 serine/threonine protein phosphatase [Sphingomonas horti]